MTIAIPTLPLEAVREEDAVLLVHQVGARLIVSRFKAISIHARSPDEPEAEIGAKSRPRQRKRQAA